MFLALYLFLYLSHSKVLQLVLNTFKNFIFEPSSRLFTLSSLIELSIFLPSPTTVKSLHSSVFYYSPSFADLQSLPSSPFLHFLPALQAAKFIYLFWPFGGRRRPPVYVNALKISGGRQEWAWLWHYCTALAAAAAASAASPRFITCIISPWD